MLCTYATSSGRQKKHIGTVSITINDSLISRSMILRSLSRMLKPGQPSFKLMCMKIYKLKILLSICFLQRYLCL